MPKILVTRTLPGDALTRLSRQVELDVWTKDAAMPRSEIVKRIADCDGLLCLLTDATADLAWALLMAAARCVPAGDRLVRGGRWRGWDPNMLLGSSVFGQTLGIVGAGRIGTAVALRSRGFEMPVVYASRRPNELLEDALGARRVELDELLTLSDFVSLHLPLTDATRHLIGARELSLMKPGAILINTARGPIVDEAALAQALKNGPLAAAGLDVFENEPAVHSELLGLENAVLLPHLGSATLATRSRMADIAVDGLIEWLAGRVPANAVLGGA